MTSEAMLATSDPRATAVGAEVLRDGGNALDAAVTAALALLVIEPHACGLGGDAFVLLQKPGKRPVALDGCGAVPAGLAAAGAEDVFDPVPPTGPRTFTVPGAIDLFDEALARFGTIDLDRATAPARRLARDGFEVRPSLAASTTKMAALLAADPVLAPMYLPGGGPVRPGDVVRNPRLADALDAIASAGARQLYEGALAQAIATRSGEVGGYLDADDLRRHRTLVMDPISAPFRGHEVWELPPPTQGRAVLAALSLLEERGRFDTDAIVDAIIEGLILTGVDLRPGGRGGARRGDTTYIACVDADGLGVSLITSVFSEFGSTVGVDAIGGPLQNRAHTITATGERPKAGKPPHTTIPALVNRDGRLTHVLGVVGGYMQAQGQIQVLVNLLVHGMEPQVAVDAPRFRVLKDAVLTVEPGHELAARMPDAVGRETGNGGFGGCQLVTTTGGGLTGGTDSRRGGAVALVQVGR